MNKELILTLVKQRRGMTTNARDGYLRQIIDSTLDNLTQTRGITLDPERADHLFFVVKYVVWEYESAEKGQTGMPAWLRLDLNNLMMKAKG